jgi:hypothetical protein
LPQVVLFAGSLETASGKINAAMGVAALARIGLTVASWFETRGVAALLTMRV